MTSTKVGRGLERGQHGHSDGRSSLADAMAALAVELAAQRGSEVEFAAVRAPIRDPLIGIPIALLMFNRTPFIASLYRY